MDDFLEFHRDLRDIEVFARHRLRISPLTFSIMVFALLWPGHFLFSATPTGEPLLPREPTALAYVGPGDPAAMVKVVPIAGQDFSQALRINTMGLANPPPGDFGLFGRLVAPVKKGDVLWLAFQARTLDARRESGEASFDLRLDQVMEGKYKWPPYLERAVSVGREWTEVSVPYEMERDVTPDTIRLALAFDQYPQSFELGPVTLINCGSNFKTTDLPRSTVKYGGSAPDAPWRKEAAARIEKYRKGDLRVKVMDKNGQPVADAEVSVRMTRLDFLIGTAINSSQMRDQTSPNAQKYRDILAKYFNLVVFDNDMKWPRWLAEDFDPQPLLQILDWAKEHGMSARAVPMIWPGWINLPVYLQMLKDDPVALRHDALAFIKRQTDVMKGRYIQWDVTNELYAQHDLVDILGRDEVVAWYKAAQVGAPDVALYYNEYTMFHPAGPGVEHYYDMIRFLLEKGAPVQGLGEQAHIGGSPPPIPLVLARLDRFSTFELPIMITELDISSNDEDFQASYLRDFFTAVFSHPNTKGIVQWGFWAGSHWLPQTALWNWDWTPRKHGLAFMELVAKTWRTDANGRTNADGAYQTRAFLGDYDVTVTQGEKMHTVHLNLTSGTELQNIVLP